MKWEKVKLGDIITLNYGKGLTKGNRKSGEIPVYGSAGINGYHNKALINGPGIILGRKGNVGKSYYVNNDFFPIDTVYYIEPKDIYDLKFVYYFLDSYDFTKLDKDVGVPGLNRDIAYSVEFYLPPLPTQQKIASILSAYDDLIENNLKRIELLEESAMLLYKEWFVDMRFPGYEEAEFVDGLPKGWERKELIDFGEVITGKTPPTERKELYNGEIPFIKTPDMHGNIYILKTENTLTNEGAKTQENKFIPKNSIIVSCIGTVGVVSLVSEKSQTNQQINALILKEEITIYYSYFVLKNLKEHMEGLGSNGATMTNVNKGKFEKLPIVKPNNNVLNEYDKFCRPIFNNILNLQQQNEKLKEARDLMLPKLMSGEIEV